MRSATHVSCMALLLLAGGCEESPEVNPPELSSSPEEDVVCDAVRAEPREIHAFLEVRDDAYLLTDDHGREVSATTMQALDEALLEVEAMDPGPLFVEVRPDGASERERQSMLDAVRAAGLLACLP